MGTRQRALKRFNMMQKAANYRAPDYGDEDDGDYYRGGAGNANPYRSAADFRNEDIMRGNYNYRPRVARERPGEQEADRDARVARKGKNVLL